MDEEELGLVESYLNDVDVSPARHATLTHVLTLDRVLKSGRPLNGSRAQVEARLEGLLKELGIR